MKKILFIYGTRPEAIKMAPLIKAFRANPEKYDARICLTGQHRSMLDQVNTFFGLEGDYDLDLMRPNQSLFDITSRCLVGLGAVLEKETPDLVFVQGDTTTVMAGALASFYKRISVAHLEAGLRSGDIYSPYPEEMNRKITSQIARYHFAPTAGAAANLGHEGIFMNVHVVGNTVIDALKLGLSIIERSGDSRYAEHFSFLDFSKRIILVTGHRRESFGDGFDNICAAIRDIALKSPDVQVVYPVHLNPNVQEPVNRILRGIANIHLMEPVEYPYLIWLMKRSYLVITDSGGIQEEAPSLGKPVLVMRDVTERTEGIDSGTARLVGTRRGKIVDAVLELLRDNHAYETMARAVNPYGDGRSSDRIVKIIDESGDGKD